MEGEQSFVPKVVEEEPQVELSMEERLAALEDRVAALEQQIEGEGRSPEVTGVKINALHQAADKVREFIHVIKDNADMILVSAAVLGAVTAFFAAIGSVDFLGYEGLTIFPPGPGFKVAAVSALLSAIGFAGLAAKAGFKKLFPGKAPEQTNP